MSLKHILSLIGAEGGVDVTQGDQLQYTTALVNAAAKEIYQQNDPVGSLREQVYNVNVPVGNMVSLEPYVGNLRAVRYFYPGLNLEIRSSAPRFAGRFWQSKDFISWEVKGDRALCRNIRNRSTLTFTFLEPLTVACNINIVGVTPTASQLVETISAPVGATILTSVNSYSELSSLAIDKLRNANCLVQDVDGNLIATLANNQHKSLYQWVQLINLPNNQYGTSNTFVPASTYVETLWKLRWKPMQSPGDEFMVPNYDEAIYWKYKENKALVDATQSVFMANQAKVYADKCNKILKDIAQDHDQNLKMSMQFGENPTLEAFAYITQNQSGYGYPGSFPQSPYPLIWP